ncbi:ammonium transporter [Caldanaerobius polysaccharolyticus]|uniref:ammonium transporter n=1 Tax=Caldanaerobius polysaccharolyticus TaxID=44256 RepID=UPI000A79C148|nr:ammonium transporter [Caldanaerobius polysaccharolyticus]
MNTGDTAFVLISAALVMFMTPGVALFYGGMVRRKNVLGTMMQSFIIIALVSVIWVLLGYSLSFGPDVNHIIGSLKWWGLNGVGLKPNPNYASSIPHMAFAVYQMMFAIITPALITGAFAERMRFKPFLIFIALWSILVYSPLSHWVWGNGGWLRTLGVLDFAGGNVVHISSGVSGLVLALVLGKRLRYGQEPMIPHNLPMVVLGAAILWFGWFGFNAGSALAANELAVNAFVTTNTAAAMSSLSWMITEWMVTKKPTLFGAASGAVAGLVAITPAAGFVSPLSSIVIGLISGILCYYTVNIMKYKLGYDDSLDAFGIHGIGGTWGAIATGLFASKAINPAGANGLFFGNPHQLLVQFISVIVTYAFAAVASFIIIKAISIFTQVRLSEEEEELGLDLTQHGEEAYPYTESIALSNTHKHIKQEQAV